MFAQNLIIFSLLALCSSVCGQILRSKRGSYGAPQSNYGSSVNNYGGSKVPMTYGRPSGGYGGVGYGRPIGGYGGVGYGRPTGSYGRPQYGGLGGFQQSGGFQSGSGLSQSGGFQSSPGLPQSGGFPTNPGIPQPGGFQPNPSLPHAGGFNQPPTDFSGTGAGADYSTVGQKAPMADAGLFGGVGTSSGALSGNAQPPGNFAADLKPTASKTIVDSLSESSASTNKKKK